MDGLLAVAAGLPADGVDAPTIAAARSWVLDRTENSRKTVNGKVARMVRMFAWAADPELSWLADEVGDIPLNHSLAEEIVPLQPDLVLAGQFSDVQVISLLRRLGIRVEVMEVETVQGYPTVTKSRVSDLESGGHTDMQFRYVAYDTGVPDDVFTERSLRTPPREWLKRPDT